MLQVKEYHNLYNGNVSCYVDNNFGDSTKNTITPLTSSKKINKPEVTNFEGPPQAYSPNRISLTVQSYSTI